MKESQANQTMNIMRISPLVFISGAIQAAIDQYELIKMAAVAKNAVEQEKPEPSVDVFVECFEKITEANSYLEALRELLFRVDNPEEVISKLSNEVMPLISQLEFPKWVPLHLQNLAQEPTFFEASRGNSPHEKIIYQLHQELCAYLAKNDNKLHPDAVKKMQAFDEKLQQLVLPESIMEERLIRICCEITDYFVIRKQAGMAAAKQIKQEENAVESFVVELIDATEKKLELQYTETDFIDKLTSNLSKNNPEIYFRAVLYNLVSSNIRKSQKGSEEQCQLVEFRARLISPDYLHKTVDDIYEEAKKIITSQQKLKNLDLYYGVYQHCRKRLEARFYPEVEAQESMSGRKKKKKKRTKKVVQKVVQVEEISSVSPEVESKEEVNYENSAQEMGAGYTERRPEQVNQEAQVSMEREQSDAVVPEEKDELAEQKDAVEALNKRMDELRDNIAQQTEHFSLVERELQALQLKILQEKQKKQQEQRRDLEADKQKILQQFELLRAQAARKQPICEKFEPLEDLKLKGYLQKYGEAAANKDNAGEMLKKRAVIRKAVRREGFWGIVDDMLDWIEDQFGIKSESKKVRENEVLSKFDGWRMEERSEEELSAGIKKVQEDTKRIEAAIIQAFQEPAQDNDECIQVLTESPAKEMLAEKNKLEQDLRGMKKQLVKLEGERAQLEAKRPTTCSLGI